MNTKEQIKIMQAFIDGKKIERRGGCGDHWKYTDNPTWNWGAYEYRIMDDKQPIPNDYVSERMRKAIIGLYYKDLTDFYFVSFDDVIALVSHDTISYDLPEYFDLNYMVNMTRFKYDPFTGEKIDWQTMKNLATKIYEKANSKETK